MSGEGFRLGLVAFLAYLSALDAAEDGERAWASMPSSEQDRWVAVAEAVRREALEEAARAAIDQTDWAGEKTALGIAEEIRARKGER